MEVIICAENLKEMPAVGKTENYEGPCQCDSGWCTYDPDSNCWNDGD